MPNRAAALNPRIGGNTVYNHPYTGVWIPSDRIIPRAAIATSITVRRLASIAGSTLVRVGEDRVCHTAKRESAITTKPGKKLSTGSRKKPPLQVDRWIVPAAAR